MRWSKDSILKAINGWIEGNGCLPYKAELMNKNGLPSIVTIKKWMGMSYGEFCKAYYPELVREKKTQKKYFIRHPIEYWIEDFKTKYVELGYPGTGEYNLYKGDRPKLSTLIKYAGCHSCKEFKKKYNIPEKPQKTYTYVFHYDLTNGAKIDTVCKKIYEIIDKY